jgi:hypothetical protein
MIPKRNIVSQDLVTLIDPSNNHTYGTGSAIRSSSSTPNMIIANPTAYTTKLNCTYVAAPSVLDPFGGTDTYLITETAGVSASNKYINQSLTSVYDSNRWGVHPQYFEKSCVTNSVYIKQKTPGNPRNVYISNENVDGNGLFYNFSTNAVFNTDSARVIDTGSQILSGGWVRVWWTYKMKNLHSPSANNPGNVRIRIYLANGATVGSINYIGDGSSGVYVYGHQFEFGALSKFTPKTQSTQTKSYSARQSSNGGTFLPGPGGQYGELFNGAPVIKFVDPDTQALRTPMAQVLGNTGISSSSNFSVFAWVNLDSSASPLTDTGALGDWCNIIGRINGKLNNNDFQIRKNGLQLAFKARAISSPSGAYSTQTSASDNLPASLVNTWAYVGITWEWNPLPGNATIKFYVNGVQLGVSKSLSAGSYSGLDNTSTGGSLIGGDVNSLGSSWGQFKGYMGMIGIYNRAISSDEMLYNYNVTKYRYSI